MPLGLQSRRNIVKVSLDTSAVEEYITSAMAEATPSLTDNKPRKRPLVHLADRVFGKVLAITRDKMDTIMGFLGPRLAGLSSESLPVVLFEDDFDKDEDPDEKPYELSDGVACIPIRGTLVKRSSGMSALSGMSGYESLARCLDMAAEDPDVKAILFDVDSPGGEVDGMFDVADQVYGMRGTVPMYAVCNDQMCSAAYAIACGADRIYITRTGMIGSVGCFMLHVDRSQADKQAGYKFTYIQAGDKKTEGNMHEPLSDSAEAFMQAEVDRIRDMFVSLVSRNRNVTAQSVMDTKAGVAFAEGGIPLFADRIGGKKQAMDDMRAALAARPADALVDGLAASGSDPNPQAFDASAANQIPLSDNAEVAATAAALAAVASIPGGCGWADQHYASDTSQSLFGRPDVVLAVRRFSGATAAPPTDINTNPRRISLTPVPYDGSTANLGGFLERYSPGCFRNGLNHDPRVLIGHDESLVLGRQSAGTARFWEDATGVHAECDVPETQYGDDLLVSLRRKDLTESSASFYILKQAWSVEDGIRVRTVQEAVMRDSSVVAWGAYNNTTATAPAAQSPAAEIPDENDYELAFAQLELLRLQ